MCELHASQCMVHMALPCMKLIFKLKVCFFVFKEIFELLMNTGFPLL